MRSVGHGKEFGGSFVHAFVGGLGGKQHGNEQLEGAVKHQLGGGIGVGIVQALEDFAAFLRVHGLAGKVCNLLYSLYKYFQVALIEAT